MELTYKDRLIEKATDRLERLKTQRQSMIRNTLQWHAKTRKIGQEKEFIKNLRDGTANISQHPEFKAVAI